MPLGILTRTRTDTDELRKDVHRRQQAVDEAVAAYTKLGLVVRDKSMRLAGIQGRFATVSTVEAAKRDHQQATEALRAAEAALRDAGEERLQAIRERDAAVAALDRAERQWSPPAEPAPVIWPNAGVVGEERLDHLVDVFIPRLQRRLERSQARLAELEDKKWQVLHPTKEQARAVTVARIEDAEIERRAAFDEVQVVAAALHQAKQEARSLSRGGA